MSGKGGNKDGNTLEIFIFKIIDNMAESKFFLTGEYLYRNFP